MMLTNLHWTADAPGLDPTARFTTIVAINGLPFRLVAHRVQRPVAAGWISGESLVDELPCDSDGRMAIDGDAWRQWWVEFDAMPDVDDDGMLPDAPPHPLTPPEAIGLQEKHEALWSLLGNTDDLSEVWCRAEGAYVIFGWPVTDADPAGLPSFDVQFEIQDETGWAETLLVIEGIRCTLDGPVMQWRMKEQAWAPIDMGEEWIRGLLDVIPDQMALMPLPASQRRALVVLRPLSEGYVIPQADVPERQRPETPVLRIFAPDDAGREAVVQLHRLITDRRLHLVDGVPKLVTEERGLFDGLRNVSVFVEGPEFDLSMVLVGSATWYGPMGICSLDGFVIATLDAMTQDSLIMALTSGAPQPVERVRGKTGAAYMPPWTADLPVLLITRDMKDTQARLDRAWSQLMP